MPTSQRTVLASLLILGFATSCSSGGTNGSSVSGALPAATSMQMQAPATVHTPDPIAITPAIVSLPSVGSTATITVSETGYTGAFTESGTCGKTASANPTSGNGPSLAVTLTAIEEGSCMLYFADTLKHKNHVSIVVGVTGFDVPSLQSHPSSIAVGSDGALWFTENARSKIGRITTAGAFTEYTLLNPNHYLPNAIAAGPDGALWFTCSGQTSKQLAIGRITTAGAITTYPVVGSTNLPGSIASGFDGAMWFTEANTNVGRITTAGAITEYPVAQTNMGGIVAGPDGAMWFTGTNSIGRITTGGVATSYAVANMDYGTGITLGADGALWYTNATGENIGRITTAGTITEYPLSGDIATPVSITPGHSGALWFTELTGDAVGEITLKGVITRTQLFVKQGDPSSIAAGPDNGFWFTQPYLNKIGRLQP